MTRLEAKWPIRGLISLSPNPAWIAFLAAILILLLGGWQIERGHAIAMAQADQDARHLSRALAEHIERSIETVELVLDGGVERLERGALDEPARFKSFLDRRSESVKQIGAFIVTNADGDWILTGGKPTKPGLKSGDRAFFRSHMKSDDRKLHIGAPIVSQIDGRIIVPLSRRWNKADGSFGGVLLASLDPKYFEGFYQQIGMGSNDSICLISDQGRFLLSQPPAPDLAGQDVSALPIFKEASSGPRAGSTQSRSAADGIDRIAGYDHLTDYPLIVIAERSIDDALSAWRRDALIEVLAVLFAAILLVVVGIGSLRNQRQGAAAEAVIRASEARHRLLTEHSSDMIAIKPSFASMRSYVSPASRNVIGWTPDEFAVLSPRDFLHPDDIAGTMARYDGLDAEHPDLIDVSRVRHKDGHWIWLESRFRLVGAGTLDAYVVSTARDVTIQRESADALAASEALYRTLADALPQMVWVSRADDFTLTYANRQFKTYHGPIADCREERLARYHAADLDRMMEVWSLSVPAGVRYEVEGRLLRHDGAYRWHKLIGIPVRKDGEVFEWVVTALDIDDIVAATRRLQETTDLLHLSQEAAGAGSWEFNLQTDKIVLSRDSARLHGLVTEESVTLNAAEWRQMVDPEDGPRILDLVQDAIRTKEKYAGEFQVRGTDGSIRWLSGVGHAYYDDAGIPLRMIGLNFDVTDRKRAEHRLLQAGADAEKARHEAERASASKSDFLANMSHEIRTPLNSVIGWTDLLLDEYREPPDLRRKLALIQESGCALLTVVNDILDFSKIEAGQVELDLATFSPRSLFDNVASMLTGLAAAKRVMITRAIDPTTPPFLLGDESRLRQILINLVNNAIKFTNAGDIAMGLKVETLSGSFASLRFTIKDSGIGIARDQQARLFERFSQVDGSITRRFGGTGLGLAISKQLLDLMGGTIGVESREGYGATFWFRVELGIAESAETFPNVTARVPDDGSGSSHILLVEDVIVNQDLAKAILERWNHTVDIASNGAEAVEMVRHTRYDLVLMDVQMPIMDGVTATRIIRNADHLNTTVPIVAMTANVLPQQIAALMKAGMDDHVGKPFKRADLQSVIERWSTGKIKKERVDALASAHRRSSSEHVICGM